MNQVFAYLNVGTGNTNCKLTIDITLDGTGKSPSPADVNVSDFYAVAVIKSKTDSVDITAADKGFIGAAQVSFLGGRRLVFSLNCQYFKFPVSASDVISVTIIHTPTGKKGTKDYIVGTPSGTQYKTVDKGEHIDLVAPLIFGVDFDLLTDDLCAGASKTYSLATKNGQAPFSYVYTSNIPDFTAPATTASTCTVNPKVAGDYTLNVKVTDGGGNIATSKVNIHVKPTPTVKIVEVGSVDFCSGNGSALLNLQLTGTPAWTLEYTIDGGAVQSQVVTTTPHVLNIVQTGVFHIQSLTDQGQCPAITTDLPADIAIKDGRPEVAFQASSQSICRDIDNKIELQIADAIYPLYIHYKENMISKQKSVLNKNDHFLLVNSVGHITLKIDSVKTDAGCKAKLSTTTETSLTPYANSGKPTINLSGNYEFCKGQKVQIPVGITGATAFGYTLFYKLNGNASASLTAAADKISVNIAGTLTVDSIRDKHGCNYTGYSGIIAQIKENALPTLAFSNVTNGKVGFCTGDGHEAVVKGVLTGVNNWTIFYRLGGNPQQQQMYTNNTVSININQTGTLYIDSIKDARCSASIAPEIPASVIIHKDDVPSVGFVDGNIANKCENADAVLDVNIQNGGYPMTLYYHESTSPTVCKKLLLTNSSTKFQVSDALTYTLDSIKINNNNCVGSAVGIIDKNVEVYPGGEPTITCDMTTQTLCKGDTVDIPFDVAGNGPFVLTYELNGGEFTQKNWGAGSKLSISASSIIVIKSFTDANGCKATLLPPDIEVNQYNLPSVKITNTDNVLCRGNLDINLKMTGKAPYSISYIDPNAMTQTFIANSDIYTLKVSSVGDYQVVQVTDANTCFISGDKIGASASITAQMLALNVQLNGDSKQICKPENATNFNINLNFVGTDFTKVVGPLEIEYEYTPINGSPVLKTTSIPKLNAQAEAVFKEIALGNYQIVSVKDKGRAGGCEGTILGTSEENTAVVGKMPLVEIAETHFAANADDAFVLSIKNPNTTANKYMWVSEPVGYVEGSVSGVTIGGTMVNEDIMFVLTGKDKQHDACAGKDTIKVFRIPNAPIIDMDTNTSRSDIKICWKYEQSADSILIMSTKWDGYDVLGKGYLQRGKIKQSSSTPNEWHETDMSDTLRFYYAKAIRYVKELGTIRSISSDTFGYYKQRLFATNAPGIGAKNFVSYPFDMSKQGIKTGYDLGDYLGYTWCVNAGKMVHVCNTVSLLSFLAQKELNASYYDFGGGFNGWDSIQMKDYKSFLLKPGDIITMALYFENPINDIDLVLFGKLPSKYTYDLQIEQLAGVGANNYVLKPLSMPGYHSRSYLGDRIPDVNSVSYWNYKAQKWLMASKLPLDWGMLPPNDWDPPTGDFTNDLPYLLNTWLPVQCTVNKSIIGWIK